jgi:phage terminase large subunit-like protein
MLEFPTGALAFAYSGERPDKLRGPEHHVAWCDELAKWAYPQATWDNLKLGLRLGAGPQTLVTTTPRPIALVKQLAGDPAVRVERGRTVDNPHLPHAFVEDVRGRYGGTRLGRQELEGEIVEDVEGALWTRELVERCRIGPAVPAGAEGADPHPPAGCAGGPSSGWTAPRAVQGMPGACPTRHSLPFRERGLERTMSGIG